MAIIKAMQTLMSSAKLHKNVEYTENDSLHEVHHF